jgi:hypothetical protein
MLNRTVIDRGVESNQASAIASLRTIVSAQVQFQAELIRDDDGDGVGDFGTLEELAGVEPPLLDSGTASGFNNGYEFTIVVQLGAPEQPAGFVAMAIPDAKAPKESERYYVDEEGTVKPWAKDLSRDRPYIPIN